MAKADTDNTRVLRGAFDQAEAMVWLSSIDPTKEEPWTMTLAPEDEDRSLKQNRLSFMWYKIRGAQTGTGSVGERRYCKLHFGVPILCMAEQAFADFYGKALDPLDYEDRLVAMDFVPVTRMMNMTQFSEYLESIDNESANQGIVLPHPEDLYWDALMKSRPDL